MDPWSLILWEKPSSLTNGFSLGSPLRRDVITALSVYRAMDLSLLIVPNDNEATRKFIPHLLGLAFKPGRGLV